MLTFKSRAVVSWAPRIATSCVWGDANPTAKTTCSDTARQRRGASEAGDARGVEDTLPSPSSLLAVKIKADHSVTGGFALTDCGIGHWAIPLR